LGVIHVEPVEDLFESFTTGSVGTHKGLIANYTRNARSNAQNKNKGSDYAYFSK
jgi:hypothetical protein